MRNKKEDKDIYELWKICFWDSDEYMDYYFSYKLRDNQVLTCYDKETLTSMVHLNPYPVSMKNTVINMDYIVGVATRPEYRKKGLMRELLVQSLKDMYKDKKPFTYLMPAKEAIYLPFDFRYVYSQKRFTFSKGNKMSNQKYSNNAEYGTMKSKVNPLKNKKESIEVVHFTVHHANSVAEFSNRNLEKEFQIFVYRDSYYYERLYAEMRAAGGGMKLLFKENELVGYFAYMQENNQTEVTECIIVSDYSEYVIANILNDIDKDETFLKVAEVKKELKKGSEQDSKITFLESHYLNKTGVLTEIASEEEFEQNGTCYQVSCETKPIIMARIVNFVELSKFLTSTEPVKVGITVKDNIIEENNNCFLLEISSEGCKCSVISEEQIEEQSEANFDIADLTSFLFGYKTLDELIEEGKVICQSTAKEKLEQILPLDKIYINEIV